MKLSTNNYLRLLALWTAAASTGLLLSLFATNPRALGPFGVTFWFIILFSVYAAGITLVFFYLKRLLLASETSASLLVSSLRQAVLLSIWFSCLLALSSLGQASMKDGLLLGALLLVVEIYVRLRYR